MTTGLNNIRVNYLNNDEPMQQGGIELIDQWRQSETAKIWIDIQQEPNAEEVEFLKSFNCHTLAIKDAHRLRHPPKIEYFDDHAFILFRGISAIDVKLDVTHLALAFFIGERFLITRHNSKAFSIDHWQNRSDLERHIDNPTLLAIRIMLFSAGTYLEQLLSFEENLSEIEDMPQVNTNDDILRELTLYKTRLRKLRRTFDYHTKLIEQLEEQPSVTSSPMTDDISHQIHDLYERCERIHSLSTMYYEICGDLIEGYLSYTSHQLNLTMRVLTVITAVFVPLSFIAGLYGMNFENMPELKSPNAYFITLGVMISTGVTLLTIFWKKRWL